MELDWLLLKAKEKQDQEAIVWKTKAYSYRWLMDKIEEWKAILIEHSIAPGQVVAIAGDYSPSICALMIALIKNDSILVPLSSSGQKNKEDFLNISASEILIEFEQKEIYTISSREKKIEEPLLLKLKQEGKPGLVLFSSGSTGKSKGAVHDFSRLLKKYRNAQTSLRTLVFLLMDHIGGINTLLHILSTGGTMILGESRDVSEVCKTIQNYKVELFPTTPTFLNLLLISEEYQKYDLSSLKMITYGTETMQEYTLKKIHQIFPDVRLKQTYGLSELGIMGSKSQEDDSLWVKLGGEGFQTKVVDGILWIKSDSCMLGYLNAPNPFDEEGWFNTQDMVDQRGEYFKILGRSSELINVGGQKVYPAEVESVILELENIKDVAVKGEKNPLLGNIVCAKVNLLSEEPLESVKKRIRRYCQQKLEKYKVPVKIEIEKKELFSARYKKMRNL